MTPGCAQKANNEEQSKIEDFFDANIKSVVIDGKTFNPDNAFDTSQHYGKKVFANKIVRQRAGTIDFGGFRPLLKNLSAAIEKHQSSVIR